jgi:hypothetical protein
MGEKRIKFRILVEKPLVKLQIGRSARISDDTIKTDLREINCEDGRWL